VKAKRLVDAQIRPAFAKRQKIPSFNAHAGIGPGDNEADAAWDALRMEMIDPLFDTIDVDNMDRDELIELLDRSALGTLYAIDIPKEGDIIHYLKVPLERWNQAIKKFDDEVTKRGIGAHRSTSHRHFFSPVDNYDES
jgi:hypothetical protein